MKGVGARRVAPAPTSLSPLPHSGRCPQCGRHLHAQQGEQGGVARRRRRARGRRRGRHRGRHGGGGCGRAASDCGIHVKRRGRRVCDAALRRPRHTPLACAPTAMADPPGCSETPPPRPKRAGGGAPPLADAAVARLCEMLRADSTAFQAEGRCVSWGQRWGWRAGMRAPRAGAGADTPPPPPASSASSTTSRPASPPRTSWTCWTRWR